MLFYRVVKQNLIKLAYNELDFGEFPKSIGVIQLEKLQTAAFWCECFRYKQKNSLKKSSFGAVDLLRLLNETK